MGTSSPGSRGSSAAPGGGAEGDRAIVARGIRKDFAGEKALDGLDLEVFRGEIHGIVGPDGAGKTTAMRVLSGILDPDDGSAVVAGRDVLRSPEEVKKRIGYMSQRFSLYDDLTVAENFLFFASLHGVPGRIRREREADLLALFRLEPFRRRLAADLSGGMRQKLALACTLVHRPEVLFLDEPTTGVDPVSRKEFWRILSRLAGQGVSILLSTPYMDEAGRCHGLTLVNRGRCILEGSPDRIRDAMRGEILEVRATPQRRARDLLSARSDVLGCHPFGDRLHVWVERSADAAPLLEKALRGAGIDVSSCRGVAPGIEDVFVSILTGGGSGSDGSPGE